VNKRSKFLWLFFLIFVIVISGVIVFKNYFVRKIIEKKFYHHLGVKINIRDVDVSFDANHITVKGVTIYNPEGFNKREMAYVPELKIYLNSYRALTKNELEFYFINLHIERLNIIKTVDGRTNVSELKWVNEGEEPPSELRWKFVNAHIVNLEINDVYSITQRAKGKAVVKRYDLDVDDVSFKNVDSFNDITSLVFYSVALKTGLGKTMNISTSAYEIISNVVILPAQTVGGTAKGILGWRNVLQHRK